MVTVAVTDILVKEAPKAEVYLIKIDDYFYGRQNKKKGETNKDGFVKFKSVSDGAYLVRVTNKKSIVEKIYEIEDNNWIRIRLPLFFNLLKRSKSANREIIRNIYEKYRTDRKKCFKCKKSFKGMSDVFMCKYCEKFFCAEHRVPETHKCWGDPKQPDGQGFREIHTKHCIKVRGW